MKIRDKKSRRFDVSRSKCRDLLSLFFYHKIYIQEISNQDFELFDVTAMVDKRMDHGTLMSFC